MPNEPSASDMVEVDVKPLVSDENGLLSPSVEGRTRSATPSIKSEQSTSRTATPAVENHPSPQTLLRSASGSKSSTPKPARQPTDRTSINAKPGPQLIGGLPRGEDEALKAFQQIFDNWYQYGTLGKSRQQEDSMICECQYEPGDDIGDACGEHSDCINRLTQVECLESECRCRSQCQNQRFQRKQYADIDIVKTEKKGFGLRAAKNINKDAFIYEYVGEVVSQPSFMKRMRQYAEEGIRHFYFMMLQKDEFIDATKKGGIGRFANHSCNPNCYVAKWVIGKHVRMGIFAKRSIKKDEELTFNYNVDRYGHDAQPCYCGEPRCVGFIGGKTQTELGGMDDLYIDALGITDEVEALSLKGTKKKRGKKLDEDFVPVMKPMQEKEVSKVVNAIRQTSNRKILVKLLTRIKITEDQAVLRQITRLRGLSLMSNIFADYGDDAELLTLMMQSISSWPLASRNKVEDSNIEQYVVKYNESQNESLRTMSMQLLEQWSKLESLYRIPKRATDEEVPKATYIVRAIDFDEERPSKRQKIEELPRFVPLPPPRAYSTANSSAPLPPPPPPVPSQQVPSLPPRFQPSRSELAEIIAKAAAMQAQTHPSVLPSLPAPMSTSSLPPKAKSRSNGESSKRPSNSKSKEAREAAKTAKETARVQREANKEKRLLKLVGAIVVKCMSKYKDQLDHEAFKRNAKDLTTLIAEKEKKSASYPTSRLDSLSEDKQLKIKKFVKTYIAKVLKKVKDREKARTVRKEATLKHSTSSSYLSTPNGTADDMGLSASDVGGSLSGGEEDMEGVATMVSDIFGDDEGLAEFGEDLDAIGNDEEDADQDQDDDGSGPEDDVTVGHEEQAEHQRVVESQFLDTNGAPLASPNCISDRCSSGVIISNGHIHSMDLD